MTIRRENGRMNGLIVGAATGLATIFAVVPQYVRAQGWQTEIAGSVKKPAILPAPAHKMPGTPGRSISRAGDGRAGAFKSEPVKVAVPTDDAPISLVPPATSVRPVKKPTPPAPRQDSAEKAPPGIERAKAVLITPLTETGDGASAIAASDVGTSPLPVAGMSIAPPVAAHDLPEAAALGAMVPVVTEPGKTDAAVAEPKVAGSGKDDKAPVLASPPPAAPLPPLPLVTGKNQTIATKSKPATVSPAEPAQVAAAPEAEEPPALITSAVKTGSELAQNGSGSAWSTSTAEIPLAAAPEAAGKEAEPVFITSAARDHGPDAGEPQRIAAKSTEKPRGKRATEPQKAAAVSTPKGKPSRSKPDAASADTANGTASGWDAPIVVSSTAAKSKDGKPGQQTQAQPSGAAPSLAVMAPVDVAPAGAEPKKTAQRTHAADSPADTTMAAETPRPAGRDDTPSAQAAVPASADGVPEEAEPDDPFVDVQLTQTRGQGDTLTTQVVPTNTPPDATSQITPAERTPAAQYCSNIADPAIDARIAWQRQNLETAEKQINERTRELEAKTAEYQRWLDRRDAFSEKAKKTVVDIYTKMKPDAAALQLQAMDEETAAAVIVKLDVRAASAVMNEMDPEKAARLSSIISMAGKGPNSRGRPAQPGTGNRS